MTSINDLLGKKNKEKPQEKPQVKPTPNALVDSLVGKEATVTVETKKNEKPKAIGFSLNLGAKKNADKTKKISSQNNNINANDNISSDTVSDPFASLGNALENMSFDDLNLIEEKEKEIIPQKNQQFQNPTLTDVEKFVFEEQPDHSTEEITNIFSSMLDDLSLATGDQVPTNVARCLKFIKEHSFLADILKPEAVGVLVNGLRKSYGFIVKAKTEKGEKRKARDAKVSDVLDSLSDLNF